MPQKIYMIGIGGIGMSALAQMLVLSGKQVSGSDRSESAVTEMLARKDVPVLIGQSADNVRSDTQLVIYSDAVHVDNIERVRAAELGIPQMSYFEALGIVSKNMRTIAVSGTHGKTTTTGMLAKILQTTDKHPTAIIGSIVRDFESNFLPGSDNLLVVEACEYKDHVLKLSPEILVITNIEYDHTDYFPSLKALQETFRTAVKKVPAHGVIVANPHDPNVSPVLVDATTSIIDYTTQTVPALNLIGEFNRQNAQAAKAAARAAFPHLLEAHVDRALLNFKGSWRRFEYKGETSAGALVYDDYAHHPTAIEKTIEGARDRFPDKKVVVAFHPHLYSRTRDLFDGFVHALSQADEIVIAPVYAAREAFDPTVSNHALAKAIGRNAIALDTFDEIRTRLLEEKQNSLIITMGAGDIYKVADQITVDSNE